MKTSISRDQTKKFLKNVRYQEVKVWNSISDGLKTLSETALIKRLREYYLSSY